MTPQIPRPSMLAHATLARRAPDFEWLLTHLHRTYGPVSQVGFGRAPRKVTYAFGPEANRCVLADGIDRFVWSEAYDLTKFLIGDTALLVSDGADHARRRRLVQPAFAKRRLDAKLPIAVAEIDAVLATWTPGRSLDAYAELRSMVRRISTRTIFGGGIGDRADEIGRALAPALAYLQRSPLYRFDVHLGVNAYARALRSRRATDVIVMDEVGRRRALAAPEPADGFDILGAILAGADEDDEPLSDTEICDQVRGLIAAGYDTTSSAAGWLVQLLGTHRAVLDELRTQVLDTIGEGSPTVEDLRSLPLVDHVVRETLRLVPPAPVGLRMTVAEAEICGFTIPPGSLVAYSPYVTHRLEELWDRPDAFDPHRWAGGEPAPYAYVPFGGGSRNCIGFALATLELQALAVRLVQTVDWRPKKAQLTSRSVANFAPTAGVPIVVGSRAGGGSVSRGAQ